MYKRDKTGNRDFTKNHTKEIFSLLLMLLQRVVTEILVTLTFLWIWLEGWKILSEMMTSLKLN